MTAPGHKREDSGWFAGIALGSAAAVVAALLSQHVLGMQPCPWCVLQRLIFVVIAVAAALGCVSRTAVGRRYVAAFTALLALCGIAASLWQHFKAAALASCNLTLADRIISGLRLDTALPGIFEPRASCADAAVNLLGVPYDFWSLALFALTAAAAIRLLRRH